MNSSRSTRAALLALAFLISARSFPADLTLERALVLADENHPALQAGTAQRQAAVAGITTARAYANPEVSALGGGQYYRVPENVAGPVSWFAFSQPLELGKLRPTRIQLAERGRDSSDQAYEVTRLGVLSMVRRNFFAVLRKKAELEILSENLQLVEEFRKRIRVRVEVGEAGRLELIRADSEVATARAASNSSRLQQVVALSQLRAAIGASVEGDLAISGQLDPAIVLPPLDELRKEVAGRHPLLALAKFEVRRADARVAYEVAQKRPQPALRVEYDRPPDTPTYRAGIVVPLPLWNKREGQIGEAVAQTRQAAALVRGREIELLAALESAYGRYQLATQQLAAYEEGLIREAEEGLRAAETAYRLGERGILEVLDAQRTLRTVRLDLLNAQYDRQAALVDLDEARGVDPRRGQQ